METKCTGNGRGTFSMGGKIIVETWTKKCIFLEEAHHPPNMPRHFFLKINGALVGFEQKHQHTRKMRR